MKIAHAAVITPGRCGLYETTRECVAELRKLGVDSRLVDPTKEKNKLYPKGDEDRGAPFADMDWGVQADLILNHSGYDNTPLEKTNQPVLHVAHGRPKSSFISECRGSTPIYSYHYSKNKDPRLKGVITFWPEHEPYHRLMFPDKPIYFVPPPTDLNAWTLEGPKGYGFHGHKGRINIVLTDAFRDDVDPFVPLHAAGLFAREVEGVKIHIYARKIGAAKGWGAICKRLKDDGSLGENQGWVGGLANVYRAATMMLTPQEINTRSVREAMACGCPVVRMQTFDEQWKTRINAAVRMTEPDRYIIRKQAEAMFNPKITAMKLKEIFEGIDA